jgi:hypothetical protein
MPFLTRQAIPFELRSKAEKEHKTRLRQALLNPALTEGQQAYIRAQLAAVGKPKVYLADSPAKTGALRLMPHVESALSPVVVAQEPETPEVVPEIPVMEVPSEKVVNDSQSVCAVDPDSVPDPGLVSDTGSDPDTRSSGGSKPRKPRSGSKSGKSRGGSSS